MIPENSSRPPEGDRPPWVPPPLPARTPTPWPAGQPAAWPAAKPVRHPADATGFPGFLGIVLALVACAVLLWPLGVWHGTAGHIVEGVWLLILAPFVIGVVASLSEKKRGTGDSAVPFRRTSDPGGRNDRD
jgi:hypothetical protein